MLVPYLLVYVGPVNFHTVEVPPTVQNHCARIPRSTCNISSFRGHIQDTSHQIGDFAERTRTWYALKPVSPGALLDVPMVCAIAEMSAWSRVATFDYPCLTLLVEQADMISRVRATRTFVPLDTSEEFVVSAR